MAALATVEDVSRRLEEAPTDRLLVAIGEMLENASDMARELGDPSWVDADSVPAPVRRIVAAAVARWATNPAGYGTSRAADEMLAWQQVDEPGAISFTADERQRLARYRAVPVSDFASVAIDIGVRSPRSGSGIREVPFGVLADGERLDPSSYGWRVHGRGHSRRTWGWR